MPLPPPSSSAAPLRARGRRAVRPGRGASGGEVSALTAVVYAWWAQPYLKGALDLPDGTGGIFESNSTVVRSPAAREAFEIQPCPMREAFVRAIRGDAATQYKVDTRVIAVAAPPAQAFAPMRRIGGGTGWYFGDAVCRLRGWLDRCVGGAGRTHSRVARRWAAAVALAAAATLQPATARAQTPAPVRTVPLVDLDRYAGDWFEIARFPNRFQRQCVGDVRASYARRPDGRLDVVNRCRTANGETEARGVARIVDEQTFARLKVRFAPAWLSFLPAVWGDYWIIGLAPDYSWAVVGDPGRDYLWILARVPHLDDESAALARAAARDNGFDVERLVPTPHAGVGRPRRGVRRLALFH